MRRTIFLAFVFILVLAGTVRPALAQEKDYYYGSGKIDITVRSDSTIRVEETSQLVFTRGEFHHVFRRLGGGRFEAITDVELWEGSKSYKLVTAETTSGYAISRPGGDFQVDWWFPYTSNASRTFTLKYTVRGGLRIYEGGDQVWWEVIWADRDKPFRQTTTTVHLPPGANPGDLKVASYGAQASSQIVDGQTVVFTTGTIPGGQNLEVRVQFPHGIVQGKAPAWQAADDAKVAEQEKMAQAQAEQEAQIAPYRDVANLGGLFLGALALILGLLGIYLLWYKRGRDQPVGLVADYLAAPPSNLPAAVVGTLIDERADMQDIVASIVDLARRGIIKITETQEQHFFGLSTSRDFVYELLGSTQDLRRYEQTLLHSLFGNARQVNLSSLREKFYAVIPAIKDQMYDEVVKEGFFGESPQSTRRRYVVLGVFGLLLVGVLLVGVLATVGSFAAGLVCIPAGLVVLPLGLFAVASAMPKRTPKGALENAKWQAFRKYLANIEKYGNLQEAKDKFEQCLPYAIVFGLEHSWVKKFAEIGTPAPGWYIPYPPVGEEPYGRPAQHRPIGSAGPIGVPGDDLGAPGGAPIPSLQEMSDGMMGGLQNMSDGLFSMLNSAGNVLSSAPKSSGGGFGGGRGGGHRDASANVRSTGPDAWRRCR